MNNPSKENPDDRPQPPQRMNSEERSDEDERHCLHFYENDQHYAHEGPHEIASWREVVSLRSALAAALARIAAVEATLDALEISAAEAEVDDGRPVIDANVVARAFRAVLAASPTPTGTEPLRVYRERPRGAAATPTGPEAAKYDYCPHGWTRAHCGSCHDEVYGPATPEPTEETP